MNKRIHISIKILITVFTAICILSAGMNAYLKKNYVHAFEKESSGREPGVSGQLTSKDGKYHYAILEKTNTAQIDFYLAYDAEELVVPDTIDGFKVTSLGDACFAYHGELKSITLPKTVDTLKMAVFGSDTSLEKAIFMGDVETIDDWAFGDYSGGITAPAGSNLYHFAEENMIPVEELKPPM